MNDIAGQALALGDTVAISAPGRCSIVLAQVIKFTPKGVIARYTLPSQHSWRKDSIEEVFRPNALVCKTTIV